MLRERIINSGWEWADDVKTLALFAGLIERNGRFWGTTAALARAIGITTRQVRRALDKLREKYVDTRRRSRGLVVTVKWWEYWQKIATAADKSGQSEMLKSGQSEMLKLVNHGSIGGHSLNIDSLYNSLSLKELNNTPLPPASHNSVNHNLVNHETTTEVEAWAKIEAALTATRTAIDEALTAIRVLRNPTGSAEVKTNETTTRAVKEQPPIFQRQKENTPLPVANVIIGEGEKKNSVLPSHVCTAIGGIVKRMSLPVSDVILTRVTPQSTDFIAHWLDAEKERKRGAKIRQPLKIAQWRVDNGVTPQAETLREVKLALSPRAPPTPVPKANCVYCEGGGLIVPEMVCECIGGEHRELAEVRRLQEEHRVFLAEFFAQAKKALAVGVEK